MAELFKPAKFIGNGSVKLGEAGTGKIYDIGDCDEARIEPETDTISVPNMRGGGGTAAEKHRMSRLGFTVLFRDLDGPMLARCMGGEASTVAAGALAQVEATAAIGGFIQLGLLDPATPPTVQDETDTTTYVAGTDYELGATGITILEGGSITEDDVLHITPTVLETDAVDLFINSGKIWELIIDGLNDENGNPYLLHWYKWQAPVTGFNVIMPDYGVLEAAGTVLPDNAQAPGTSKYGTVKMLPPA